MAEHVDSDPGVEPAGESIHLPGPSYLPVIFSAGTTVALVGVVVNWFMFGLGAAVALVSLLRWVGQVRAEMAELPLEHGH